MKNKFLIPVTVVLTVLLSWIIFTPAKDQLTRNSSSTDKRMDDSQVEELTNRIEVLEQRLNDEQLVLQDMQNRLDEIELTTNSSPSLQSDPTISMEKTPEISELRPRIDETIAIEERLLEVGMASDTIAAMKYTVDQNQLEMLRLRDKAIREGWDQTKEFSEQMFEVSNPLRGLQDEFGDESYDKYLYASGTPNRVQIREVYSGSAAESAGLQPGDIFIGYDSSPIYSMSNLRQSTVAGNAGESVLVELKRDNQTYTSSVPRGPLGISMSSALVKPD
jgi:hypothetical protein